MTLSFPYSPESNGLAERMNRISTEKRRAMLYYSSMNRSYWCEVVRHAAELHNQTTSPELNNNTPTEALLGTIPNNMRPRTFGCMAFVHKHKETWRDKFEKRVEEGVFLGSQHGLYRIWLSQSRKVMTRKHATFNEQRFHLFKSAITRPEQDVLAEVNRDNSRTGDVRAIKLETENDSENTDEQTEEFV